MTQKEFEKVYDRFQLIWLQEIRKDENAKALSKEYLESWRIYSPVVMNEAITLAKNAGVNGFGKLPTAGQIKPYITSILDRIEVEKQRGISTAYIPGYNPQLASLNRMFWNLIASTICAKQSGLPISPADQKSTLKAFVRIIQEYKQLGDVKEKSQIEILLKTIQGINQTLAQAIQIELKKEIVLKKP